MDNIQLLKQADVKKILQVSDITLEQWRLKGKGPRFIKVGRCVRYRMKDLEDYIDRMTVSSTTEAGKLKAEC